MDLGASGKSRVRGRRWWIAKLVLVALLGGGWYAYVQHRASRRLEESERLGQRMLATEFAADQTHPTLATPVQDVDARAIYAEVLAMVGSLDQDEKDLLSDLGWWEEGLRPVRQEVSAEADVEAVLAKTRPMVERLRAVLRARRLSLPPSLGTWDDSLVKSLVAWRVLKDALTAHARRHAVRGEVDQALDVCVALWLGGRDFAVGGGFMAYLVGHSLVSTGATDIRRILATCEVGPERLDRLASELDVLRRAMPGEKGAWRREEIGTRRQFPKTARELSGALGIEEDMLGLSNLYSDRVLISDALAALRGRREAYVAAVEGKPGLEAVAAAEAYAKEVRDEGNPLVARIFAVGPGVTAAAPKAAMTTDLLRVTVALARHRERHGKLPAALNDLVPAFLPAIPTCAYTGAALHYDGDKVWSIGGNARDDGGFPLPFGEHGVEGDGGDVVFTLHRRELRTFPWPADVNPATRTRVEEAIQGLYRGGRAGREGRAALVALGHGICGRLISEFKSIADSPGFASREGRVRAGALDATLRGIDGAMEYRWEETARVRVTSEPAFVRKIALRWTNWWYRGAWHTDPLEPWEPEDD